MKDQGKLDEAVACYRRALELKPDYAEAHDNLGNALKDQGKLDEAVACYRRALELKPDYAEAHNNLGNALKDQGKLDEAVACYRRALELKPDYAEAHNNLGNVFEGPGEAGRGGRLLPPGTGAEAGLCRGAQQPGQCPEGQGKLDEAAACFRQVVQRVVQPAVGGAPSDQEVLAINGMLPTLAQPGPWHAEMHNSVGNAFLQLATILKGRLPDDDLLAMRQLLSEPNLRDDDRAALQFGLAQVLDARGDYRAAAEHLGKANAARLAALKQRKRDYSPAAYRVFRRRHAGRLSRRSSSPESAGSAWKRSSPSSSSGCRGPAPRWWSRSWQAIRQVFGAGELPYCDETFQSLPKAMNRNDTPFECLLDLDRETTRDLARAAPGPTASPRPSGPCGSWTRCPRTTSTSV